ncbi:MAG: hypothetical protein LQ345_002956 [Seirophora villosa]|nr:MAG: hypothetical protein LQ345_002956 [Seirophora villosa]
MLQAHDRTATIFVLLLATVIVYVGAQATIGVWANASSSSVPTPSSCAFTRVNHIIHSLPQQCFTTPWPGMATDASKAADNLPKVQEELVVPESKASSATTTHTTDINPVSSAGSHHPRQQASATHSEGTPSTADVGGTEPSLKNADNNSPDSDIDSPLDNAHFLSFEEWKKRNLAEAGQSADNVGGGRSGAVEPRRKPGAINNALDSLGEDAEIEIDFGGFVNPPAPGVQYDVHKNSGGSDPTEKDLGDKVTGSHLSKARSRSKDAGITCKERSNYASFDCASSMLKTNPECKSATSVLVENKDSYMLNLCAAKNKFFIVELCDDILVDTVVLANFEFFSSIFRTFRVSVSDKYPVRLDKWRELGTFEAQNSRGIQAFLVDEPQIWARYLRIEFLTHYGHEYYCPVSLLRVHGTTMMEEFNHELKNSKGEEDADDEEQQDDPPVAHQAVTAAVLGHESRTNRQHSSSVGLTAADNSILPVISQDAEHQQRQENGSSTPFDSIGNTTSWDNSALAQAATLFASLATRVQSCSRGEGPTASSTPTPARIISSAANVAKLSPSHSTGASPTQTSLVSPWSSSKTEHGSAASSSAPVAVGTSHTTENEITGNPSKTTGPASNPPPKSHSSPTHPIPPNPTTQESFFKSVHKRLQLLESNSTLSLQYIEDQSRILRDAFAKVEKRQLAKTNVFLELLNSTVLNEVREFRTQYDQIWQSTVLELSSQRHQSQSEIAALSTRLTLLADELLFQKRIAILQFLLILLCLGLAIFFRGGSSFAGADYLEHVVSFNHKSSASNLSRYASTLDSPQGSPPPTRPSSRYGFFGRKASSPHLRSPSEESTGTGGDGAKSPSIEYSRATPTSLSDGSGGDGNWSPDRGHGKREGVQHGGLLSPGDPERRSSGGGTTLVDGNGHGESS